MPLQAYHLESSPGDRDQRAFLRYIDMEVESTGALYAAPGRTAIDVSVLRRVSPAEGLFFILEIDG